MKWKKVIPLLVVMVLILTGCGQKAKNTGSEIEVATDAATGGEETDNLSTEETSTEPEQVTWFSDVSFWNPPTIWSTDENTVQGAITKTTGLTFEMDIPPQDGVTKLSLMLVKGTLPDIMSITDTNMINQLVESEKVWKLDEFLTQYDPDSHLLKDFPEDVKEAVIYNEGGWYSFSSHINSADMREVYPPSDQYYIDSNSTRNNNAIMFNKELMDKAGITLEDLQTEDEVLAVLEKVKGLNLDVNGASVIPMLIDGSSYQEPTLKYLIGTFGGMPVDGEGNYRDLFLAPEAKHALKFLNTAVLKGYMDPNQLTIDNNTVKEYIANQRVFCFIGNTANTSFEKSETTWVSPGAILSSENKIPVLEKGQQAGAGWMQTFISKDCKNPEKIAKWLSYMSSKEGLLLATYGFEGVDYTMGSDGLITQTEKGLENVTNYSETGVSAYWPFANTSFVQSILPAPTSQKDLMVMDVQCAFGKDTQTQIYDGSLVTLPSNLIDPNSDAGINDTQIKSFKEAQISKIVMAEDEDSFNKLYDELVSTMEKYGIADIDALKTEAVKANYERYGSTLSSINGD